MIANFYKKNLIFKRPGGTSRGVLHEKDTYILEISREGKKGIGECGLFRGLSYDDKPDYEQKLKWLCDNINQPTSELYKALSHYPSIWFGYEQALRNLEFGDTIYYPSEFTQSKDSITINGLIWMGGVDFMKGQIEQKLSENFHCIKLKIGVHWEEERSVIEELRQSFPKDKLELRVDANGAFSPEEAIVVLQQLSDLGIHSIEQPIKAGQWSEMARLCSETQTPIALDEELIGVINYSEKVKLLDQIKPQYIILKPSLVGGFKGSDEWITLCEERGIGWWITSALESNIGLNAIAQYTYTKHNAMPQGLGTGALFTNNFDSALELKGDQLFYKGL